MHLPDGYLSPETTLPALAIMLVVWYSAFKKIQLIHNQALIPSIALCAAFSFILMMFNIPVVGGSSAHAVGAAQLFGVHHDRAPALRNGVHAGA